MPSVLKRQSHLHAGAALPVGLDDDGRRRVSRHDRVSLGEADSGGRCVRQELRDDRGEHTLKGVPGKWRIYLAASA